MAVLSDRDIRKLVAAGILSIEPFDESLLTPNGVDLRLGRVFCRGRRTGEVVDTKKHVDVTRFYECVEAGEDGFVIWPGDRVLAHTVERVRLPRYIAGLVHVRSTFARLGLYVPPTVIDAGFEGSIVVEIVGGSFPVRLYPGQRFLHVVLVPLSSPSEKPYNGRYQGQDGLVLPLLPVS